MNEDDQPEGFILTSEDVQLLDVDGDAIQLLGGEVILQCPEGVEILLRTSGGQTLVMPAADINVIRNSLEQVETTRTGSGPTPFEQRFNSCKQTGDFDPLYQKFLGTRFFALIAHNPEDTHLEDFEFVLVTRGESTEPALMVSEYLDRMNQLEADAVEVTGAQLLGLLTQPHPIAIVMNQEDCVISRDKVQQMFETINK